MRNFLALEDAALRGAVSGLLKTLRELHERFASAAAEHLIVLWIGKQRPQQRIVERMAGAHTFEAAKDGRAGQCQIANGIEDFVADEFVGKRIRPALTTRSPSMARVFSSDAPRPSPAFSRASSSATKPKVRAGAISRRKLSSVRSRAKCWVPMAGEANTISKSK